MQYPHAQCVFAMKGMHVHVHTCTCVLRGLLLHDLTTFFMCCIQLYDYS